MSLGPSATAPPVTTRVIAGPGSFGSRKWATLPLVLTVATLSGLMMFGFAVDAAAATDVETAGRVAFGIGAALCLVVLVRSLLAGYLVTDDHVRVRGIWATRTVRRDDVAGFVMECDAAGRFQFPAIATTDGRRIRARWAFRRGDRKGALRTTQEIVDAFTKLGWYDENRLDTALNAVDAVRRGEVTAYKWHSPPGWPDPPAGWRPAPGWRPPPDWPSPPTGWQFWQPVHVPLVTASDVEVDPDDVAPEVGSHLDRRYRLDVEVAQGLPDSNWGLWEAVQAFLWAALLIGSTIPLAIWVSERWAGVLGESAIGLTVVLAARKAAAQSGGWRKALGWDIPKPQDVWFALRYFGWNMLARFVAGLIIVLITLPLPGKPESNVRASEHGSVLTSILLVIVAVFIAPVVEEFFFRGLLLRAAMRRFKFWPAAIVTSILFGLAHVSQVHTARGRLILGGTIAVFGLVQCLLARRKARLGPNMLVHGFANGLVVIFALA